MVKMPTGPRKKSILESTPQLGPTPQQIDDMRDARREAAAVGNGDFQPHTPEWDKHAKAQVATRVVQDAGEAFGDQLAGECERVKPVVLTCANDKHVTESCKRKNKTQNNCRLCGAPGKI